MSEIGRLPSRQWAGEDAHQMFASLPYPAPRAIAWLRAQGVTALALAEPELPRLARVVFHADAPLFDLASETGEDGVAALVFLARDDGGEASDLVAWSCYLGKVAAHFGAVPLLGADSILAPRLGPEAALSVHRTPLKWLKAERQGVVLLSPERAAIALRNFGPFAAEDEEHGRELRGLFRYEPQIFMPEARAAA